MKRKPRPVDESIFAGGVGRHVIWVGILIAILTLGGFVYGFYSHGMDPFAGTLGLEEFTRAELLEIVDEENVPENWDDLDEEQRIALIEGEGEGGFEEESSEGILGDAERIPRTIAFTILAFTQMFEVMAIHAGDRASFFRTGFANNRFLLLAVLLTFVLQLLVVYVPFLQETFDTAALSVTELLITAVLGSVVLFGVELEKVIIRREQDADLVTNTSTS